MSQRWRVVCGPIIGNTDTVQVLVAACCALHNYLRINNDQSYLPPGSVDAICGRDDGTRGYWRGETQQWQQAPPTSTRNSTILASEARVAFTEYFNHEGTVPWQRDCIYRCANN